MNRSLGLHGYTPGGINGPDRGLRELQATVSVTGHWAGQNLPEW